MMDDPSEKRIQAKHPLPADRASPEPGLPQRIVRSKRWGRRILGAAVLGMLLALLLIEVDRQQWFYPTMPIGPLLVGYVENGRWYADPAIVTVKVRLTQETLYEWQGPSETTGSVEFRWRYGWWLAGAMTGVGWAVFLSWLNRGGQ